jgi:hypothetical protein
MSTNSNQTGTAEPAVITVKQFKLSPKLQAEREAGLKLLEERTRRQAEWKKSQEKWEKLQEEYRSALLEEKKLSEEKEEFDVLRFCQKEQERRRRRETILNIIGKR